MPMYEYECPRCDYGRVTRIKPVAEYRTTEVCAICGGDLKRLISRPIVRGDIEPYQCPITGKPITSRRAHEENLLRHDCRVLEKGEKEDLDKRKAREEDAFADRLAETAGKLVHSMPQEKQEALVRELTTTDSVTYNRI